MVTLLKGLDGLFCGVEYSFFQVGVIPVPGLAALVASHGDHPDGLEGCLAFHGLVLFWK